MTQKAAASLSSSLFAHKGKASPASLLISEMEAANGANGRGAPGRSAANGSARRKPKAAADLPLLAYVDAQTENEPTESELSENDNDSDARADAVAEIVGEPEAAGEKARPAPVSKAELPPAASLLDRGAKPLRRANGRAAAVPQDTSPPVVEAAVQLNGVREDADAEDSAEAETVSGDANVAAIEDATDEDLAAERGAAASPDAAATKGALPVDLVAPDTPDTDTPETDTADTGKAEASAADAVSVEAESGAAEDVPVIVDAPGVESADATPAAESKPATEAKPLGEAKPLAESKPRPAIKSASEDKTAAAMAASVALRHAKTLNAEPGLRAAGEESPRPVKTHVTPPRPRVAGQPSRSYLWRGAAVVVLGAALGFGAYLVFAGKPAEPAASATAPVTAALPDPAAEPSAPAASPATPSAAAAAVETAAPPEPQAAAAALTLPEPSFDIIRIEPDGQSIIAGRAEPYSEWILLNNGTPIASVRADINGEWVVLPDASLVPGANAFSLVAKTERGKVAIPAPDAAPVTTAPQAAPANEAQVPAEPRSDAPGDSRGVQGAVEGAVQDTASPAAQIAGVALPKPKPVARPAAGEARALPGAIPSTVPSTVPNTVPNAIPNTIRVSSDGAYEVQLASVRQTVDAARERDRLASAFPDLLGSLDLRVQEATVDGAGIFYRVRSGAIADLGLARDICRQLEAGGQGCLVVRRSAEAVAPEPVTELVEEVPAEPAISPAGQQAERPQ